MLVSEEKLDKIFQKKYLIQILATWEAPLPYLLKIKLEATFSLTA